MEHRTIRPSLASGRGRLSIRMKKGEKRLERERPPGSGKTHRYEVGGLLVVF
jgi:hypothetical protein